VSELYVAAWRNCAVLWRKSLGSCSDDSSDQLVVLVITEGDCVFAVLSGLYLCWGKEDFAEASGEYVNHDLSGYDKVFIQGISVSGVEAVNVAGMTGVISDRTGRSTKSCDHFETSIASNELRYINRIRASDPHDRPAAP